MNYQVPSYHCLPSEIWMSIFQHSSRHSLLEFQKVCKKWYILIQPILWNTVTLENSDQVDMFLENFSKDSVKFIKSMVIGIDDGPMLNDLLETEQVERLLLNLPHIEEINIKDSIEIDLAELNNKAFLKEFRRRCPCLRSFEFVWPAVDTIGQTTEYLDILYFLQHTLTKLVFEDDDKLMPFEDFSTFQRLEYLTVGFIQNAKNLERLFNLVRDLNYLKSLTFAISCGGSNEIQWCTSDEGIQLDVDHVQRRIEQDQTLKKRLASVETLILNPFDWFLPTITNIFTRYFVGLKYLEIYHEVFPHSLNDQEAQLYHNWLSFVFSHDQYKVYGETFYTEEDIYYNAISHLLQTHFNHLPCTFKNVLKRVEIELDGIDYSKLGSYRIFYGKRFDLKIESKRLYHNQLLKTANLDFKCSESNVSIISELLNSNVSIIQNTNELVLKLTHERHYYPYNSLQLFDQILSMTTNLLKKVAIDIPRKLDWNEYYARYKTINTYPQVEKLELYLKSYNYAAMNEQNISQFADIFPCIKHLTIQYYDEILAPESSIFIFDLTRLSLNKLTLDVTIIKLQTLEMLKKTNTLGSFFLLEVATNQKTYYYHISLDFLHIHEIAGIVDEYFGKCGEDYLKVCIAIKNVQCLEIAYMRHPYEELQEPHVLLERKIYFA